jgi:hypothetical protein
MSSKRLKHTEEMSPGGARSSKQVQPTPPNDRPTEDIPPNGEIQAKRAKPHPSNETPSGVSTQSSRRQQPIDQVQQEFPPIAEYDNGLHNPREHEYDWSYERAYYIDGLGGEHEEHHEGQEDELHEQETLPSLEGKCHLHLNSVI